MESGGNEKATRYEPLYEASLIVNNPTNLKKIEAIGVTSRQAATSYGLMQIMFMAAYALGCRSIDVLLTPDQNIRYGAVHLKGIMKDKRNPSLREALAAYNGGIGAIDKIREGQNISAAGYADKVISLFERYKEYFSSKR